MLSFLYAFVAAALLAAVLTPLVRKLALGLGAVKLAGGRHVHRGRIPRLGGVGVCVAMVLPVATWVWLDPSLKALFFQQQQRALGLLVGGLAMCALGAADDTRGLSALQKLAVQLLVAVGAFACGYRIDAVVLPVVGELSMGPLALPVTLFWIVGIVNALNLIDGLDGLAVGVAFFAGVTNVVVAFSAGQFFTVLVMCSLLGALLGFLLYNFNPARIFAGDSGSYLLGYVLAVTALSGSHKTSTAVALLVPVVALGVPIFDTLYAMVRRLLARRPLLSADRGHLHHRLLDSGVTHRRAVLILYGVSVAFTVAAIGIYLGRSWQLGVGLAIASVLVVGLVRFVGAFSQTHLIDRTQDADARAGVLRLRRGLPRLLRQLEVARDEPALYRLLQRAVDSDLLCGLRLVRRSKTSSTDTVVFACGSLSGSLSSDAPNATGELTSTIRVPLGEDTVAKADVLFDVAGETDSDPQRDILLQLLVDVLSEQLRRHQSSLVGVATSVSTARDTSLAADDEDASLATSSRGE